MLAFATRKGYLRSLLKRLPHTWVTVNLGLAGIFAIATPLIIASIQLPLPPWIVIAWWAFAVLGALVGMLLLILYDGWSVRRGYLGWCFLAWGEGEVTSAPWRRLWWLVLLSYGAVIGGMAGSAFIQQLMSR
jgi:hypothetical protein